MRIAMFANLWALVPPLTYGGTKRMVCLLTGELVNRGHDVTFFASGNPRTRARLEAACPPNLVDAMQAGGAILYERQSQAFHSRRFRCRAHN